MRRAEAEQLIGQHVRVWTAANGQYVGTLLEVYGSPWRGKVRITGVLAPAVLYERGRFHQRRGFRPGEIIDAGNSRIHPESPDVQRWTYAEALPHELAKREAWRQDPKTDPAQKLQRLADHAGDSTNARPSFAALLRRLAMSRSRARWA